MLITQTDLEKHLQINFGTDPDPIITDYLAQAQAACEAWCRQPLEHTAGIETVLSADQSGIVWLDLPRFPITAVTSIVENSATVDTGTYSWYPDGRIRRDTSWTTTRDGITVTYDAGYGTGATAPYDTVPADLVLAIVSYAADLFRNGATFAAQGPVAISQISLEGSDSITYATTASGAVLLSDRTRQLLAPYQLRPL